MIDAGELKVQSSSSERTDGRQAVPMTSEVLGAHNAQGLTYRIGEC
jgi:hypothetical protein